VCGGTIAEHGSSSELRLAWPLVAGLGRGEVKTKRRRRGSSPKGSQRMGVLVEMVLPLHGSPQLGFMPRSAQAASPCSRGALQGLDGAWEVVCCCGGNGARARVLRWGKVVMGAMGRFFYRSRSPGG
jgi:hypothetical protein